MTVLRKVFIAVGVIMAMAIVSVVLGYLYLIYGFGRMGYESRNRCDSILAAWKSYSDLAGIERDAIIYMNAEVNREGKPDFAVPFGDTATYIAKDSDRYLIEYGGGHHHYGVMIFRDIKMADAEMRPSVDPCQNTRVHERIVFYDE